MADYSYQPLDGIGYTRVSFGYRPVTPLRVTPRKMFVGLLVALSTLLAGVGLIGGIITPTPWAAAIFVVGMLLFYVSSRLAQHALRQNKEPKWLSIT
jgi:hypothetical protein